MSKAAIVVVGQSHEQGSHCCCGSVMSKAAIVVVGQSHEQGSHCCCGPES